MISALLNILAIIGLMIAIVVAAAVLILAVFILIAGIGKIINLVKDTKGEGGR